MDAAAVGRVVRGLRTERGWSQGQLADFLNAAEVALRLFDADGGDDGRGVFRAAAALTEMAGWMAHDAGRDDAARRHLARARDLAHVGDDRQLSAHILASLSHHARHVGRPAKAIQLAQDGRDLVAAGPWQPELAARLLAMQARAHAEMGEAAPATQLLRQAEDALGADEEEQLSPWVSRFDEGSLASEAARSFLRLGDTRAARAQAERILQIRAADRTRSRAFAQLALARALIARDEADEACAVVDQALDATRQLSSFLVIQQLGELRQLLAGQDSSVVTSFLPRFESELAQRSSLYDWLRRGDHERSSARGTE